MTDESGWTTRTLEAAGTNEIATVVETAERACQPVVLTDLSLDGPVVVSVPNGRELRELDLEPYRTTPRRKTGTVRFVRAESFISYVNMHTPPEQTNQGVGVATIWADIKAFSVTGVLNDHRGDHAGWKDHRAILKLEPTPAWTAWTSLDGQQMPQVGFAEFIEERITEIAVPSGAELLTIARSFEATKRADFRSDVRLDNGQVQFTWAETIDGKAGSAGGGGNIEIPASFTLVMSPFEGYDPIRVEARLRYRLKEGVLTLGFHLDRLEDVVRDAFAQVAEEIEEQTNITVWYGTP
jgi:uncharacterized protein YfdQ (DUF2303 family)